MASRPYDQLDVGRDLSYVNQFKQQKLRAWQLNLEPMRVLMLYAVGGVAFLAAGYGLLGVSSSVQEVAYDYTESSAHGQAGMFTVTIEEAMEPPIYIYYQLDQFYQNHRRYVVSRDPAQLAGGGVPKTSVAGVKLCEPWKTNAAGVVHYPCGLVARSVFNDTFVIQKKKTLRRLVEVAGVPPVLNADADWWKSLDTADRVEVDSSASAIAWPADVASGRFKNLDPEASPRKEQNQRLLDMWILRRFPPMQCVQTDFSSGFEPVDLATRKETVPVGFEGAGTEVEVPKCTGYNSDSPMCEFVKNGMPFSCGGKYKPERVSDWGIESGHFMVWMRVAGLPTFRKLWGVINTPLEAGTTLNVHARNEFPVQTFGGRKAFVISTSSIVGGRSGSGFLAWGYIVIGFACFLFAGFFYLKQKARPT